MEESVGKQEELIDGERRLLLRLGIKKFGAPSPILYSRLERIADAKALELLGERLLDASDWESLLSDV